MSVHDVRVVPGTDFRLAVLFSRNFGYRNIWPLGRVGDEVSNPGRCCRRPPPCAILRCTRSRNPHFAVPLGKTWQFLGVVGELFHDSVGKYAVSVKTTSRRHDSAKHSDFGAKVGFRKQRSFGGRVDRSEAFFKCGCPCNLRASGHVVSSASNENGRSGRSPRVTEGGEKRGR